MDEKEELADLRFVIELKGIYAILFLVFGFISFWFSAGIAYALPLMSGVMFGLGLVLFVISEVVLFEMDKLLVKEKKLRNKTPR